MLNHLARLRRACALRGRSLLVFVATASVVFSACASDAAPVSTSVASVESADPTAVLATPAATTTAITTTPATALPTPTALTIVVPTDVPTPTAPTTAPEATAVPTAVAEPAQPEAAEDAPTRSQQAPPPESASQAVLAANGAEIYTLTCARCHGANGTGAVYGGLIGVSARYNTQSMIAELTDGHPVTFGFRDTLTAEEIASVVAYVIETF